MRVRFVLSSQELMFAPSIIIVLHMLKINSMQIGNLQQSTTFTVPFLLLEGNGFAFY